MLLFSIIFAISVIRSKTVSPNNSLSVFVSNATDDISLYVWDYGRGTMAPRRHCTLLSMAKGARWHIDSMAPWHHVTMGCTAHWHRDTLLPWHSGTMEMWHTGTVTHCHQCMALWSTESEESICSVPHSIRLWKF